MTPINSQGKSQPQTLNIDALMQCTWLLVVELRQGATVPDMARLMELGASQVAFVRQKLQHAGISQRTIDHISLAQCALLDETVLNCVNDLGHSSWAGEPLQARFFNRHQAGVSLYEDMRDVLREPAPDPQVLVMFQRVLALGFQGQYRDQTAPERAQLLAALNERAPPLVLERALPAQRGQGPHGFARGWLRTPLLHALAGGLLLLATWYSMDRQLGVLLQTLLLPLLPTLPGQV
jgi:type VI secretion system protein ImpK